MLESLKLPVLVSGVGFLGPTLIRPNSVAVAGLLWGAGLSKKNTGLLEKSFV